MRDEDLELLITLDYPWYAPDEDTFNHLQQVVTPWPGYSSSIMSGYRNAAEVAPSHPRTFVVSRYEHGP